MVSNDLVKRCTINAIKSYLVLRDFILHFQKYFYRWKLFSGLQHFQDVPDDDSRNFGAVFSKQQLQELSNHKS